jgi:murein DD-endopeptidase MepM/ murein hydrolase activator NlpD
MFGWRSTSFMRNTLVVLAVLVLACGGVYVYAGRLPGPAIVITRPSHLVGAVTPVELSVTAPGGRLTALHVFFDQDGKATELGSLAAADAAALVHEGGDAVKVTKAISRDTVPDLKSGPAQLRVEARRPVLFGLRQASVVVVKPLQVRLEQPSLSVVSTHHYINVGGAEMVVYRVRPDDVASGVSVGDREYPGFPAASAAVGAIHLTDPSLRVAFFSLLWNDPTTTAIHLYAYDDAGNRARADLDYKVFPKAPKRSTIDLNDAFLDRVVPAIEAGSPGVKASGSLIDQFLVLNGDLRRKNAATIAALAAQSSPEMLWRGEVFYRFANTKAESAFADQRTYRYDGRVVDHQTHLGFDLASFAHASVKAANRGKVVYAADLGIYGNCIVLDHGMGVQSLYAHLSSIEVQVGAMVDKAQELGRSGETGMAAGDHLHFTMLVNGQMVNPIEWWDPHWIQDRIVRKLSEAR